MMDVPTLTLMIDTFGLPGLFGGAMMVFFYLHSRAERTKGDTSIQESTSIAVRLGNLEYKVDSMMELIRELRTIR